METKAIKDLPRGEYFRLQDSDTAPVWVRGEYIRQEKKYSTHRFDDVNHERLLPGTKQGIRRLSFLITLIRIIWKNSFTLSAPEAACGWSPSSSTNTRGLQRRWLQGNSRTLRQRPRHQVHQVAVWRQMGTIQQTGNSSVTLLRHGDRPLSGVTLLF